MAETTLEKPKHGHHDAHYDPKAEAMSIDNQKFAMWLYLASEVVIFTVFIGIYVIYRINNPESVHAIHEDLGIWLVSANTFILLTSSWAMVMGLRQIQLGNKDGLIRWLSLTALLGSVFMVGQYIEYYELSRISVVLDNTDTLLHSSDIGGFGARFYTPTFFHGVHVFVGVLWCLEVIRRARKDNYSARNYVGVEVFGLYWHFVDVVWIILFALIYLV